MDLLDKIILFSFSGIIFSLIVTGIARLIEGSSRGILPCYPCYRGVKKNVNIEIPTFIRNNQQKGYNHA